MHARRRDLAVVALVAALGAAWYSARRDPSGPGAAPRSPAAGRSITVYENAARSVDEATLFAFDDVSLPFRRNLVLTMHPGEKHPGNPVLRREPGRPDESRAQYLGTVLRHQGKFKMWYIASDDESFDAYSNRATIMGFRAAYAESVDGIHWVKPKLGLVDYHGNRDNNLVAVDPPGLVMIAALSVLHEPDDPDPSRRFKMMAATLSEKTGSTSVPLYSADGLRWRLAIDARLVEKKEGRWTAMRIPADRIPLPEFLEQGGLFRWGGMYHVAGQQLSPWIWMPDGQPCGRVMAIYRSRDFVHWSDTKSLGFVRYGYRSEPKNHGEESHEPASIWNRGNVLVGNFGLFHGKPGSDDHPMDLGFLVSNDGIRFREPQPDFAFVPRGQPGSWESQGVLQGQGFENVGDRTYVWYGGWNNDVTRPDTHAEIGLVTLRRDGFGSLSPKEASSPAVVVSAPVRSGATARIWLNAEGLSPEARLRVELLDETETPLPAYSGEQAIALRDSGVRLPVTWRGANRVALDQSFRVKITFEGERKEGVKLYAVYVGRE